MPDVHAVRDSIQQMKAKAAVPQGAVFIAKGRADGREMMPVKALPLIDDKHNNVVAMMLQGDMVTARLGVGVAGHIRAEFADNEFQLVYVFGAGLMLFEKGSPDLANHSDISMVFRHIERDSNFQTALSFCSVGGARLTLLLLYP